MNDNPFVVTIYPNGLCGCSPPEVALDRAGVRLFTVMRRTLPEALHALKNMAIEYVEPHRLTLAIFVVDAEISALPGNETNA